MNMFASGFGERRNDDGTFAVRLVDESDLTRWLAQSDAEPGEQYLVDLLDYPLKGDCNGSCTCANFAIRMKKLLDENLTDGEALRCKHIERVREAFVAAAVVGMREKRNWKIRKETK